MKDCIKVNPRELMKFGFNHGWIEGTCLSIQHQSSDRFKTITRFKIPILQIPVDQSWVPVILLKLKFDILMKFKCVILCENWVQKWAKILYIFGIYPSDLLKNISFVKMKRWSYLHIHCKLASPKINCLILYELASQMAHDNILFNLVQVRMAQAGMVANSRYICTQVRLMLRQKFCIIWAVLNIICPM